MPRLIRHGKVVDDAYVLVRGEALADVPDGAQVIVPLASWRANRDALRGRDAGVWLAPSDDPLALADDAPSLTVIAVDFPSLTDGRGYSTARLLRERLGYQGELRAIGDIQRDQVHYLWQVGFDAFAPARDAEGVLAGLGDFSDGYQATYARTPWFARRSQPVNA